MATPRINDASGAQAAAKRYLLSQFGADKLKAVSFTRAWYTIGSQRDVWEVEGDLVVKTGWFSKEQMHFRFQIDPETGRVIAYEV